MADGSLHSLYMVAEVTAGTTPTNPALSLVRSTGTTLGLAKDSLQSEEIRSDRQISDFRLGANQVGGDINFELSYNSFDALLKGVLQSAPWAVDTPIAGTDQLKAAATRESFTFVRHFSDVAAIDDPYYIYRGVEIDSMSLSISSNAMITGSFSVFGQTQELANDLTGLGTPTFPAATTTTPVDAFTGTLTEGGGANGVITEISLTLSNGIAPRFVVGSKNSITPSTARSNLTGSITAYFEDSSLVSKFVNETESDIEFNMPDKAGNNIKVIIPRIIYTGGQPDVSDEGPITLTMPFQALLDPTEGTNIIIEKTDV